MSTPIYLANDKYSADLSQKYTVGDAIIYVTSVIYLKDRRRSRIDLSAMSVKN